MKVNWDDDIPNISGKISKMATKPPTRKYPTKVGPDTPLTNASRSHTYILGLEGLMSPLQRFASIEAPASCSSRCQQVSIESPFILLRVGRRLPAQDAIFSELSCTEKKPTSHPFLDGIFHSPAIGIPMDTPSWKLPDVGFEPLRDENRSFIHTKKR